LRWQEQKTAGEVVKIFWGTRKRHPSNDPSIILEVFSCKAEGNLSNVTPISRDSMTQILFDISTSGQKGRMYDMTSRILF
jgi:hypothetical protein